MTGSARPVAAGTALPPTKFSYVRCTALSLLWLATILWLSYRSRKGSRRERGHKLPIPLRRFRSTCESAGIRPANGSRSARRGEVAAGKRATVFFGGTVLTAAVAHPRPRAIAVEN